METSLPEKKIVVNDRYQFLRRLGSGTQGAVYEVTDTISSCRRALKLCANDTSYSLETEYFHLVDFQHPNMARVFDFQRIHDVVPQNALAKGQFFFTEELVDGVRADNFVRKYPFEQRPAIVARIGIGVARALRMMHSRGLLHLDVKPSNILVDEDGIPRLIDLGLARLKINAAGVKAGTLGYMGPEVFDGLSDERTDIFALGQVLIQLLSGASPSREPGARPRIPASVPESLARVLRRMVHSRLEKRYSARETIVALRASGVTGDSQDTDFLDDTSETEDSSSRLAVARATRFVGREKHVLHLASLLDKTVQDGGTRFCVINGPLGIGKTRLVRKVVASRQVHHARHSVRSITFLPGSLSRIAEQLMNPLPEPEINAPRTMITDAQYGCENSVGDDHVSEAAMTRLFGALMQQSGPIVVLLEEATSLQIVNAVQILQASTPNPDGGIFVIFENSDVAFHDDITGNLTRIVLEPLSIAEEQQMVEDITGVQLPRDKMEKFHQITGGNPRFSEALIEQFFFVDNRYQLGDMPAMSEFPEDASVLVAGRLLANVNDTEKQILSSLSLVAGGLNIEELRRIASGPTDDALDESINHLRQWGYIQEQRGRTILVPYLAPGIRSMLAPSSQKHLHHSLYSKLSKERPPEQIGRHAFWAGLCEAATPLLRRAADSAIAHGDTGIAIDCLEMLTQCHANRNSEFQLQLVKSYRRAGRYKDALLLVEQILTVQGSDEGADKVSDGGADEALFEKAAAMRLAGQVSSATEILDSLVAAPDLMVQGAARGLLARIYLDKGEMAQGLSLVSGVEMSDQQAHTCGLLNIRGLLLLTSGDVDGADNFFRRGLDVVRGSNPIEEGRYHSYRGMVSHAKKDWGEAARRYEAAFRLADEAGDSHGAATYVVNWAAALTETGDLGNALVRYRNGMNRLRLVGRPVELVQTEANYVQLLLRLGDAHGAMSVAQKALHDMQQIDNPLVHGHVRAVVGETLLLAGQYEGAAKELSAAAAIFETHQQTARRDFCLLHWSETLLLLNRFDDAFDKFSRISDDAVVESLAYVTQQVLIEIEGNKDVSRITDLLEQRLSKAPSSLSLEYYQAMAALAVGLFHGEQLNKCQTWCIRAIDTLDEIRRHTPAVHQPDIYPYELQLQNIRTKTEPTADAVNALTEEDSMKQIWMERLVRIAARLNSELNIDAQLDIIMDTAIDVTGAERGFLLLREDDGNFSVRSARNLDSEAILASEMNYSGTIARRAFELREPIVTTNAQEDERYRDYRSVAMLNLMYIVAVPLLEKGKAKGTIYLDSTLRGKFDNEHVALLKMLANQAAVALTNARLMQHVQHSSQQIEALNRRLESKLANTERELAQTRRDLREMNESMATRYSYHGIIGSSKPMKEIFRMLDRISATDIPVVISGESGTGKELVARAIHRAGARRDKAFVAENCAAIPSQLLESILFGHVRGAFTGAVRSRNGLFVEAHGGTLFLDEIADMPMEMQSKLLRVLQEGEVRPVGQNHSIKVDVRILVASNADLKTCVRQGTFREDLYYRLHVMEVRLPPLRERVEDIPILARHFVGKHSPNRKIEIAKDTLAHLMHYRWPGNIRELENEIVRATVMCHEQMEVDHFSDAIRDFSFATLEDAADLNLDGHVNRLKSQLIRAALKKSGGNRSKASDMLGISRYGLQKMMTRLDLLVK